MLSRLCADGCVYSCGRSWTRGTTLWLGKYETGFDAGAEIGESETPRITQSGIIVGDEKRLDGWQTGGDKSSSMTYRVVVWKIQL